MNTEQKTPIAQVRLLLPENWIEELDAIARSRFISRLSLIRHYLRTHIDRDLESLRDQLALTRQNQHTVNELTAYQSKVAPRD